MGLISADIKLHQSSDSQQFSEEPEPGPELGGGAGLGRAPPHTQELAPGGLMFPSTFSPEPTGPWRAVVTLWVPFCVMALMGSWC